MKNKFRSLAAFALIFINISAANAAPWVNKSSLATAPNTLNVNTCDYRITRATGAYYSTTYFYTNERFLFKKNTYATGPYGTSYGYIFEVPLDQLSAVANTTTLGFSKASEFVNRAYLNAKTYSMSCQIEYSWHSTRGKTTTLYCSNNAAGVDAAFTDALPLNASSLILQEKCD